MSTKDIESKFVGSFFELSQIPTDRLPQIAVAGRSNVGKSSLLNKLLWKKKLAKVSSTPGKTRSLNFFNINEKFYLVDLPGYGYAKVSRSIKNSWGKLIRDYLSESKMLVGLLLLLDCRREPNDEDKELIGWLISKKLPVLIIMTKTDKLSRSNIIKKVTQLEKELGTSVIPFSAVTGDGRSDLTSALWELLENNASNRKARTNG